jgi:hypothetical protein
VALRRMSELKHPSAEGIQALRGHEKAYDSVNKNRQR